MIFINCRINPRSNAALEWRRECPDIILAAAMLAMECHSLTNSLVSINGHEWNENENFAWSQIFISAEKFWSENWSNCNIKKHEVVKGVINTPDSRKISLDLLPQLAPLLQESRSEYCSFCSQVNIMVVAHELTTVGATPCFTCHSSDVAITWEMQPEETSTSREEFCKNKNYLVNKCKSI
jgi:hypothetical protein